MKHSESIKQIATALHQAQGKLTTAKKDAVNPHFKSKYADLGAVWDAARPVLQANGLVVTQTFSGDTGEAVTIDTTLIHSSGEWLSSSLTLKPTKPDPQGIGSAITYGRRYGLSAILGIVADEDDDGNAASASQAKSTPSPIGTPVQSLPAYPTGWPDWTFEERGQYMANNGSAALKDWWANIPPAEQKRLKHVLDSDWKNQAQAVDAKK
jgi:hypothetical protein